MKHPKVLIYTLPSCGFCQLAKEYLTKQGIGYKEVNLLNNQEATDEMLEKSGQTSTPVIDIDGQIIVGFNEQAINNALNI